MNDEISIFVFIVVVKLPRCLWNIRIPVRGNVIGNGVIEVQFRVEIPFVPGFGGGTRVAGDFVLEGDEVVV